MFEEDESDELSPQNFHGFTEKDFRADEVSVISIDDVSIEDLERMAAGLRHPAARQPLAPAPGAVKTLREMFQAAEVWNTVTPAAGIRRLREKRVNRNLTIVADWMLGLVENHQDDEMALVVLLEQAEKVRQQIAWPEMEAHEAAVALVREVQELEQS